MNKLRGSVYFMLMLIAILASLVALLFMTIIFLTK